MSARHAVFTEDPAAVLARHRALLAKPWQCRSIETAGPLARTLLDLVAWHLV
jgi:hypothetical protein